MVSVNQSAPSGPATISCGRDCAEGNANSVRTPDVVIRAIAFTSRSDSVNHSAPSGPATIASGLVLFKRNCVRGEDDAVTLSVGGISWIDEVELLVAEANWPFPSTKLATTRIWVPSSVSVTL